MPNKALHPTPLRGAGELWRGTVQIEIGIAIEIEEMTLGHEKLDVYRLPIDYVAWVYEKAGILNGVHLSP
jgi:hypothetical protein